ncbi:MAG: glycosyl transferase [Candidatus Roseilinea sp.]|nr:MAG: glycosyl transferase [Candidatus Roseilinea sp.]
MFIPASANTSVDLSVIILTYNTRDLTCACVQSVIADAERTPYTVEIVVVDNASTDGTVTALRQATPDVHIIVNASNLGFSRGNNVGLRTARGRYMMLLNSDTEIQPDALQTLIAFMDAHPDAGACGPMLLNADGSLQPSGRPLPSMWTPIMSMTRLYRLWKRDFYRQAGRDYNAIAKVGEVSGAALLVRREAYVSVGGLDPNLFAYYEDIDWCKRIGDAGFSVYYVPGARVVHYWQSTSRSVSELAYRAGQNSRRYYYAKHHGPIAHAVIQCLLATKELALITAATLKRDTTSQQFHRRMLANVFTALPPPTGSH